MGWSYDSTLKTRKDQVRFLLRDTDTTRQLLQDEEILWLISTEANVYMAAAACADTIATKVRDISSKSVGGLSISYGASARTWEAAATRFRLRGSTHQGLSVGGLSKDERDSYFEDSDLIQPEVYGGLHYDPTQEKPSYHVQDEETS